MESDPCRDLISISLKAMDVFHKSYEVSNEGMQKEYAGLYAEIEVAFRLLRVIQSCVEPFRTHGNIKQKEPCRNLSQELQSTLSKSQNPNRIGIGYNGQRNDI